ncbi:photosystem II biogenesis protein Psp29 [Pseudanabaena sp. UWO310]|uniref:photosystem II biogenesis protein Psp29 n=1 Tax=Pseudanabaena sp. UWO310 TaxID=2480795 RepID=UPI0011573824|nr:photosystem II biogenesis protein Psp29 [Pseudanabaena sp. UWO310]TYQ26894.1 photosystem II biogenesis protein Psp29 [Pseudanabaena sp. UWO310]
MNTVRTVSDTKKDFYLAFPKPVNQVYRRVVDELLVEIHLLKVNQTFVYDAIFALGFVTTFDRFTAGYKPETDRFAVFHALCAALQFDSDRIRQDAATLSDLATRSPNDIKTLLTNLDAGISLEPLSGQLQIISAKENFKYSRLLGVGLYALLEISDPEAIADSAKREELIKLVGETLKFGSDRLLKDVDLYRSNLDKIEQARQMIADMVEAERKKRSQKEAALSTAKTTEASSETPDNPS